MADDLIRRPKYQSNTNTNTRQGRSDLITDERDQERLCSEAVHRNVDRGCARGAVRVARASGVVGLDQGHCWPDWGRMGGER